MYGLDKDENLELMFGAVLTQICVGENEIILNFDKPVSITILADFAVASTEGAFVRYDDMRHGTSALLGLIGNQVEHAEATDQGGLLMVFESGRVQLFDTSKEYESMWIKLGDKEIIV